MLRMNPYGFYNLAARLQFIAGLTAESRYGDVFLPLIGARLELHGLLGNTFVPVRTCRAVAIALIAAITRIIPVDVNNAISQNKDATLDPADLFMVQDAFRRFETVLKEELSLVNTYSVSQKGAYSTEILIANARGMFPSPVASRLPPQAANDFDQAGRCLAFETSTAAAFHVFRAIEAVMTEYYEYVTGKKKPTKMRNWAVYIDQMGKSGKADAKILDLLNHIRDKYGSPQLGVGRRRPGGRPQAKPETAYGRRGKPRPPAPWLTAPPTGPAATTSTIR
jgi:hypothetical protein